jgi:hypothetical protein
MPITYIASVYADNFHEQLEATFAIELADAVAQGIKQTESIYPDQAITNRIHEELATALPENQGFWLDPPVLEKYDKRRRIDWSKAITTNNGIRVVWLDNDPPL